MIRKSKIGLVYLLGVLVPLLLPFNVRAYEEQVVANGGTIRGFVKYQGALPKLLRVEVTKAREVCGEVPNESLVIGHDRGLRYAVVTLEGIANGKAVEKEVAHELDNVKCRFVPHVQAAVVDQFLVFKNTDPILHTAHAVFQEGQPQFNVGLYPGRVSRKPLISPGIVKIFCEVHPWMSAYIIVTDNPYNAVTDAYGEYQMEDVPPGTYRLKVWQESLGTQEKRVEVKGGGLSKVDFIFTASPGARK